METSGKKTLKTERIGQRDWDRGENCAVPQEERALTLVPRRLVRGKRYVGGQ